MGVTLKLDPDNAAKSLVLRIRQIETAKEYIRQTYGRYEGLKSLDRALDAEGVLSEIKAIAKSGNKE
jgi:hypothetical protein